MPSARVRQSATPETMTPSTASEPMTRVPSVPPVHPDLTHVNTG